MKKINFYKYLINLSLPLAILAFLFFMIGIIKTATKETIKLEGHWHLTKVENGDETSINNLCTIDFEGDSTAILNKGSYALAGSHDSKEQILFFGGECFMLNFFYEFDNGDLKLFRWGSESGEEYFLARQCDHNCCDKQLDYFQNQVVEIDLPINRKATCFQPNFKSLENDYYFGLPKNDLSTSNNSVYQLVLGERFSKIKDIDLYIEKHKIKVPENKRSRIYRVIYADKNTPIKTIAPTIEYLKKKGERRIYFATRQEEMREALTICLSRIDVVNFNPSEDLLLNEWLRTNF